MSLTLVANTNFRVNISASMQLHLSAINVKVPNRSTVDPNRVCTFGCWSSFANETTLEPFELHPPSLESKHIPSVNSPAMTLYDSERPTWHKQQLSVFLCRGIHPPKSIMHIAYSPICFPYFH